MQQPYLDIAVHLGGAWLAGSLVGLERSFHGRPAGFRTHALVCLASALLMMVTAHQWEWLGTVPLETVRTDPTRIAQDIMTGIGFLGRRRHLQGRAVHSRPDDGGLDLDDGGARHPVWRGALLPGSPGHGGDAGNSRRLCWLETRMPCQHFALHVLRFPRDKAPAEAAVRRSIAEHGFTIANLSYRLEDEGKVFEYRMIVATAAEANFGRLAEHWKANADLIGFRISPTGD